MRTTQAPSATQRPGDACSRRSFLKHGFLASLLAGSAAPAILSPTRAGAAAPVTPPTADLTDPVYHFLNRISWGVKSADLARARRIGTAGFLEEQLSAKMVAQSARVAVPPVLKLPRAAIYRTYKKDPYEVSRKGLVRGMIARAVHSPAQLYERVVEFWSDHFNIAKQDLEPEVVDWQRTVIRKHAFGKFGDLLQATTRHPAMLYYLDNAYSNAEHPNENYARELLELHTFGVDGGYTEADVKAVARVFTGWTADYHGYSGFIFDEYAHDTGDKLVLGQTIAGIEGPGGVQEGIAVLTMLANDLRTAKFICKKLCTRFISDAYAVPGAGEQALIDSLANTWQSSGGDIKAVLRALFTSAEFAAAPLLKLRRPLEFLVAAQRATGTIYRNYDEQEYHAELLDQVPYEWGPPNGYPDVAPAWATTAGLLARWTVAQALTDEALPENRSPMLATYRPKIRGVKTVGELVDRLVQLFLSLTLPAEVRASLIAYATDSAGDASTPVTQDLLDTKLGSLAGLVLSTPQFQLR